MIIIGLTGGIGSGKTTVSNLFSEQGVTIVDADIAAREVVKQGCPALLEIRSHFGNDVINPDGALDRKALRQRVFDDEAERLWLETLLHPLIKQRIQEQLKQAKSDYAILSSPLLLETDQHEMTNRILVVDVPEAFQLDRASARDQNNREQIKAIIATQMDRETRCAQADDIILNDSTEEALREKVLSLHHDYLKLANNQQVEQ